jgi:hypothetical protein
MNILRGRALARPNLALEPSGPTPAPLSLSDRQLERVMVASTLLPFDKRSVLLERVAAELARRAGPPRDGEPDR